MLEAAGLMRGAGTRIDVANKNIGAYKYSFNPLQVGFFLLLLLLLLLLFLLANFMNHACSMK